MPEIVSTTIFSDRARYYAEHRPSYPAAVFNALKSYVPVPAKVADIGAGTGIFSRGLIRTGYCTVAVEPNAAMRAEAIATTADQAFHIVEGRGEATTLDDTSVDLVTVAQAFHWLDPIAARQEFLRISRSTCTVAVVWNSRQFEASPFMSDYRAMLLEHAPDYQSMKDNYWKDLAANVQAFLGEGYTRHDFPNPQRITLQNMLGNLLSTSYIPKPNAPGYADLIDAAHRLFDTYQENSQIVFELKTILYIGALRDVKT